MNQKELKIESEIIGNKILEAQLFEYPFKHIVIDNFFSENIVKSCLENFPDKHDKTWEKANDKWIEVKSRTTWKSEFDIPEWIIDAVRIMNSSIFLKSMSEKMWIKKIVSDPYYTGWWLNLTLKDWILDIHVDWNYHDATWLNRRLNALLYLNPDWKEWWWWEFELWDEKAENCIKKVEPLCNRLVIFDSHDLSFHGSPNPLNFPENDWRRSILLYYYTKEERPNNQIKIKEPHSALWKKKWFMDKRGSKTREYY